MHRSTELGRLVTEYRRVADNVARARASRNQTTLATYDKALAVLADRLHTDGHTQLLELLQREDETRRSLPNHKPDTDSRYQLAAQLCGLWDAVGIYLQQAADLEGAAA